MPSGCQLDSLTQGDFLWMPYSLDMLTRLPSVCTYSPIACSDATDIMAHCSTSSLLYDDETSGVDTRGAVQVYRHSRCATSDCKKDENVD